MINSDYCIIFSKQAYIKYISLNFSERRRFLYSLRNNQGIQHRSLTGLPHGYIRIRFNLSLRIIAKLTEWDSSPAMIVLDFVNHDQMDRRQFCIKYDNKLINIADIDEAQTNDEAIDLKPIIDINQISYESSHDNSKVTLETKPDSLFFTIDQQSGFCNSGIFFSEEQYDFIQKGLKNGQMNSSILEGGAGSGKTSVAICQALLQPNNTQIGYVTYNPYLAEYTKRIARELSDQELPSNLELDTFVNICRNRLTIQGQEQFDLNRRITKARFLKNWNNGSRRLASVVWREMQETLKGSLDALPQTNNLMTWELYQTLGDEYIESTIKRIDVYRAAEHYQQYNQSHGYWDDLDLTLALHKGLDQIEDDKFPWHILYCDEVQDFAEIQLYLLLRLVEPRYYLPPAFLLTGDPAQILNPSGFSWQRVNNVLRHLNKFHTHKDGAGNWNLADYNQPEQFSLNFRSQADIVNLSNQINRLRNPKARLLESFKISRGKPFLIQASQEDILSNRTVFGPRNAIIVIDPQKQEQIIEQFSTLATKAQRVLDIANVKGLEFEQVLVLGFFSTFHDWQNKRKLNNSDFIDYIENCLYVCATRADQQLIFVEDKSYEYWNQDAISSFIRKGSAQDFIQELEQFFTPPLTPEDWLKSAREYEEQRQYAMAQENYERGGDSVNALRMQALICEDNAEWQNAGDTWKQLKVWEKALTNYKNAEQNEFIIASQAEIHEVIASEKQSINNYRTAAQLWQNISQWQKARTAWENAGDYTQIALCQEKLGEFKQAAYYYKRLKQYSKAAETLERGKCYEEAAVEYRDLNQLEKAAQLFEKANKPLNAASLYDEMQQYVKAAQLFSQHQEHELASLSWQKAAERAYSEQQFSQAHNYWLNMPELTKVINDYQEQNQWAEATECWIALKDFRQAALCAVKMGNHLKAAQFSEEAKDWHQAAENYIIEKYWLEAAQCYVHLEQWSDAAQCYRQSEHYELAAIHWEKANNWREAIWDWQNINNWEKIAKLQEFQGNYREAAIIWEQHNQYTQALNNYELLQDWYSVARLYKKQKKYKKALYYYYEKSESKDWESIYECAKLIDPKPLAIFAQASVALKKWESAAEAYQQSGNLGDAAQSWVEAGF